MIVVVGGRLLQQLLATVDLDDDDNDDDVGFLNWLSAIDVVRGVWSREDDYIGGDVVFGLILKGVQ